MMNLQPSVSFYCIWFVYLFHYICLQFIYLYYMYIYILQYSKLRSAECGARGTVLG
jgi:hypothetical protein